MSIKYLMRCDGCNALAGETYHEDPWILPAGWRHFTAKFYGGPMSGNECSIDICKDCWGTKTPAEIFGGR